MLSVEAIKGEIMAYDGTAIYYEKDIPEQAKAIVIIVHGFAEHLGRYEYFKDKLNDLGYGVYRFDNRGHGRSGGKKGHLQDFNYFITDADAIVEMAKNENPSVPIFMFGHSMGGFITSAYGIRYKEKLRGQILSGAATMKPPQVAGVKSNLFRVLNKIVPRIKVKNSLDNMICHNQDVVKAYKEDPLNLKYATLKFYVEFLVKGIEWLNKNMSEYNYPCLILHGANDKIVSKQASENFYNVIKSDDKKIIIYESLYHEIINEDKKDDIVEDIHIWMEERIS
ncbi:lysophospholipase [Brassicibacter mesophilus]|uniref:alpha/beta hydrolase n=1 Tax=Brassicibacter mesophilus TaxID=745119 RepID=UPI003D24A9BB